MKIIIAGIGKVGALLTKHLAAEGYDITLIDSNGKMLSSLVEQFDVMAIHGNCASLPVLEQAGIREADLLIATTNGDETNLLSCITAQGMNRQLKTIARIRNHDYAEQIHGLLDVFSISMVINPERQAAREIERLLKFPGFSRRDTFAKGRVEIVEVRVNDKSPLCNVALGDLTSALKLNVLVCSVLREGTAIAPDGNFVLKEGDRIFVTAPTDALSSLLKNLNIITRKVRRVLICGGGRVSLYLAQALEKSDISVCIIEQNPARCEELAERLLNTEIILGDASNQAVLQQQHMDQCDALVAMTGMDELNMVISLFGDKSGVPQVVTKLSRMETTGALISGLDLGSIICPKELSCNSVVRYVRALESQQGAATSVHTIADGQVEALEFTVSRDTRYCGEKLKDIQLVDNILITAISRGTRIEMPSGNSSFREGDRVIVVKTGDTVIHQLNDIFA